MGKEGGGGRDVRLKLNVRGQGGGRMRVVGLENWTIFMKVIYVSSLI